MGKKLGSLKQGSIINNVFYYVNSPIASLLLHLYSEVLNGESNIINELNNGYFLYLRKKSLNGKYDSYRQGVVDSYKTIKRYYNNAFMSANIKLIVTNLFDDKKYTIDIPFSKLFSNICAFYYLENNDTAIVENIFTLYKKYLDDNYTISRIIIKLFKINNMFAIGFVFVKYLIACIKNNVKLTNDVVVKIMNIITYCLSSIIFLDNNIYVSNHKLEDVINFMEQN